MHPSGTTLQIKSIKITRLFGIHDHWVELKQDRVTVIHGTSGVGKTALLRLPTHPILLVSIPMLKQTATYATLDEMAARLPMALFP